MLNVNLNVNRLTLKIIPLRTKGYDLHIIITIECIPYRHPRAQNPNSGRRRPKFTQERDADVHWRVPNQIVQCYGAKSLASAALEFYLCRQC